MIWESSSTDTISYVLGGSQLISQTRNGTPSYFLPDGQGSTRALTDTIGNIATDQAFTYTAFGDLVNGDGTTYSGTQNTNYLYTGQQFDDATDMYSLRARYYNPTQGRFVSRDTWAYDFQNPVELNRYGYTANNPVNWSDPSGHFVDYAHLNYRVTQESHFELTKYAWSIYEGAMSSIFGYYVGLAVSSYAVAFYEESIGLISDVRLRANQVFVLNYNPMDAWLSLIFGAYQGAANYAWGVVSRAAWWQQASGNWGGIKLLTKPEFAQLALTLGVGGATTGATAALWQGALGQVAKDQLINIAPIAVSYVVNVLNGTMTQLLTLFTSFSPMTSFFVSSALNTSFNVLSNYGLNQLTK